METSNSSTGAQLSLWTSSVADTPASHSAQQESDEAQTILDTCGRGCETPLAHYGPDTRSWRTFEDISLWGDLPSLESLPKSGMTRNGVLYPQPEWERLIDVSGSSSWPTPRSSAAMAENLDNVRRRVERRGRLGAKLEESVAMWPTPTTVDTFTPKSRSNPTLGDAARKADGNNGKLNPTWVEWLMGFPLGWTDLEDSETP
jgi:hypothetical protein